MRVKPLRIGILFPDGDIKGLAYGNPTRDGFMYGVSYSDTHITALPETHSISFHLTTQSTSTKQHLGRIIREGNYEDLQLKALNPKIITDSGLDEQVGFITGRGMELLNQPSKIFKETETDKERIILVDLFGFFQHSIELILELKQNFLNLFGLCTARDILSNDEYEAGFTSRETAVIEVDGNLYEVDIKAYLDLANDKNPLQEIIGPLGLPNLMLELDRRFKEVIEEKKESLENYSFPDSLLQP